MQDLTPSSPVVQIIKNHTLYYNSRITELDGEKMAWDHMIEIPHKNDLELGQSLVFEFIDVNRPDARHQVRHMFTRKGAYGIALKSFLRQTIFLKPGTGLRMNESRRLSDPGARRIRFPYRISCREIEGLFSRLSRRG